MGLNFTHFVKDIIFSLLLYENNIPFIIVHSRCTGKFVSNILSFGTTKRFFSDLHETDLSMKL